MGTTSIVVRAAFLVWGKVGVKINTKHLDVMVHFQGKEGLIDTLFTIMHKTGLLVYMGNPHETTIDVQLMWYATSISTQLQQFQVLIMHL